MESVIKEVARTGKNRPATAVTTVTYAGCVLAKTVGARLKEEDEADAGTANAHVAPLVYDRKYNDVVVFSKKHMTMSLPRWMAHPHTLAKLRKL